MKGKIFVWIFVFLFLFLAGGANAYTNLTDCHIISAGGEYRLNTTITNSGNTTCFAINSDDVVLRSLCKERTLEEQ